MATAHYLSSKIGIKKACSYLGIARASYYRFTRKAPHQRPRLKTQGKHPLALSDSQKQAVLDCLHSERFVDKAPQEIYATLLDEGVYLCSQRTMYRYLQAEGELKERRQQRRLVSYKKPELLATAPNQLWSWDITKLKGPAKWNYFHLYVILDVYSRCVVGWLVANRESSILAQKLIKETCRKHNISHGQLVIHSDRGSSMKSKAVALLLSDLGVTKSHSRPHNSNDNPFSEAQFKTLKYRPEYPNNFGCLEDARTFSRTFFEWYNQEHRHNGIALLTPNMVHYGQAAEVLNQRALVLKRAYSEHPERFKGKVPVPDNLPQEVWINKPENGVKLSQLGSLN